MKKFPLALSILFLATGLRAQQPVPGAAPVSVWDELAEKAKHDPPGFSQARSAIEMRPLWKAYYAKYAGWKPAPPPAPPAGKLSALIDTPTAPRFKLTDRVWPEKAGDASVCLWEDDKLAAGSFGIDDNNAQDVPAWEQISAKYGGLNITWNLITANIGGTFDPHRVSSAGTWELWQRLLDAGYQIGSHSVTHVGDPVLEDGWPGPDWETQESQKQLDTGLKGQKTKMFACPGAAIPAFNGSRAWRPSIAKYYAAGRGSSGNPVNQANMTDYFDIRTSADPSSLVGDTPKFGWPLIGDVFKPESKYYRGWITIFIHNINGKPDLEANPGTVNHAKVFDFYNKHRDDLWVCHITDGALYGQERDTATLTPERASNAEVVFGLTSKMDPARFDYPLTVKVRLPDGWKGAKAQQNGKDVPAKTIDHEGKKYALVAAKPDAGSVRLTPGS